MFEDKAAIIEICRFDAKKSAPPQSKKYKQELFCRLYVSDEFCGNGMNCYAIAFDKDLTQQGQDGVARTGASRLLIDTNVLKRIDELIEEFTLNDQFVDKELGFVIKQKSELGPKVSAIREYNKMRNRIENKVANSFDNLADAISQIATGTIKRQKREK